MLSWKNVLCLHTHGKFSIDSWWEMAKKLEYEYFMWNDRVFLTSDGRCTEMTIKDVQ